MLKTIPKTGKTEGLRPKEIIPKLAPETQITIEDQIIGYIYHKAKKLQGKFLKKEDYPTIAEILKFFRLPFSNSNIRMANNLLFDFLRSSDNYTLFLSNNFGEVYDDQREEPVRKKFSSMEKIQSKICKECGELLDKRIR